MSCIKEIVGFTFWMDNAKRAPIETLLEGRALPPSDRQAIFRSLDVEALPRTDQKKTATKFGHLKIKR